MKFGKEENIDQIDFELKFSPLESLKLLKSNVNKPNIMLGATGWSNKNWKGIIYPHDSKSSEYLYYYSRNFQTIELNTTHYRIPTITQVVNWKNLVSPVFKFCPKILQLISHSRDLGKSTDNLVKFLDAVSHFEDNLGPCFLQLPPYFDSSKIPVLKSFLQTWPHDFPISIEFRHESFYSTADEILKLNEYLATRSIGKVLVDVAGRRDMVHQPLLTSHDVIIRFVGNFPHTSDLSRLDQWSDVLHNWAEAGIRNIYFMIHQSQEEAVLYTACILEEKWNSKKLTPKIMPLRWIDGFNPLALQP